MNMIHAKNKRQFHNQNQKIQMTFYDNDTVYKGKTISQLKLEKSNNGL